MTAELEAVAAANAAPVACVEAEEAFIGSLLTSPAALPLLAHVEEYADFTQPQLRTILGAIRRMVAAGTPVDAVTVHGELRRAGETASKAGYNDIGILLAGYADRAPVPSSAKYYLQGVIEASLRRRCLEVGVRLAQSASVSALDDLLEQFTSDIAAIAGTKRRLTGLAAA